MDIKDNYVRVCATPYNWNVQIYLRAAKQRRTGWVYAIAWTKCCRSGGSVREWLQPGGGEGGRWVSVSE